MKTSEEVAEVLRKVSRGEIDSKEITTPPGYDSAWRTWKLSNGWILQVFNDAGDFDYVEGVMDENGVQTDAAHWITLDGWSNPIDFLEDDERVALFTALRWYP